MLELYINDIQIDLAESAYIGLDFEVNNLGSIETRQGFKSNDFNIQLSNKNVKTLGFTNLMNLQYSVANISPFIRQPAAIKQFNNYLAIGFIQIVKFNNNQTATVSFFGSNTDWFLLVRQLTFCDLDFSQYDHTYTAANIVASYTNTEGYIYPLIDYGKFSTRPYNAIVDEFAPAVFVSTIVKLAFQKAGYKISGTFLDNIYYKRLIIPFSKKGWLQQTLPYLEARKVIAQSTPYGQSIDANVYTKIEIDDEIQDNFDWFTNSTLTTTESYDATLYLRFDITFVDEFVFDPFLSLFANGVFVTSFNFSLQIIDAFRYRIYGVINQDINIIAGQAYTFEVFNPNETEGVLIEVDDFLFELTPKGDVQEGQLVPLCINLPKVSISDLLLTLCYQFTLFFQVNPYTRTVDVFQFQDLYKNIPNAKNWSDKLSGGRVDEMNFTEIVQNYGQNSIFKYQENDNDTELDAYFVVNDENFGSGDFQIANDFIETEKTLLESKFAPTINTNSFQDTAYIPFIPIYELNNDEFQARIDPKPRILMLTGVENIQDFGYPFSDFTIEGNLGNETVSAMPFTYFFKQTLGITTIDNFDFGLAFDVPNIPQPNDTTLIEKYYLELNRVLNAPIYLKAFFQLRQIDIDNLDFSLPIYLGYPYNSYFFLNKIKQFRNSDTLTECELIQLK
jgi:hypothetical protein